MTVTATHDPLLLAILADIAAHPEDAVPALALADYLLEMGPGEVRQGRCPEWLRRAWLRARKADARTRRDSWRNARIGWGVLMDMEAWLAGQAERQGRYWQLDHHGSTLVGGLECFANEPYADLETARAQAQVLAAKAGCVGVGLAEGHWARGTVRVLLLPIPDGKR
jgi:hypothetical protein